MALVCHQSLPCPQSVLCPARVAGAQLVAGRPWLLGVEDPVKGLHIMRLFILWQLSFWKTPGSPALVA